MLENRTATPSIAVKDIEAARRFYEGVLGLPEVDAMGDEVIVCKCGDSTINVYRSEYAGTNQATALSWTVGDDLDRIVGELKGKGVAFEHYAMPDVKHEGDVHRFGDMRVAWFKDPDGNILSLSNH
jgi:catechol 2,3-dioxygenase-like lactoylglutathione lyase family enzyme